MRRILSIALVFFLPTSLNFVHVPIAAQALAGEVGPGATPDKTPTITARQLIIRKRDRFERWLGFGSDNNLIERTTSLRGDPKKTYELLTSWNVKENKENWTLTRMWSVGATYTYALSPDGKFLLACGDDRYHTGFHVWNAANGKELFADRSQPGIVKLAFDAGGQQVVSMNHNSLQFWKCGAKGELSRGELLKFKFADGAFGESGIPAFSPDLTRVAKSLGIVAPFELRVWEVRTQKEIWALKGLTSRPWKISYSPCGKWLVASSFDHTTTIWDANTGKEVRKIEHGEMSATPPVCCHAISRDGRWLATGSGRKSSEVAIWELPTGKKLLAIDVKESGEVIRVAFNQRGDVLAASSERALYVWELSTKDAPPAEKKDK